MDAQVKGRRKARVAAKDSQDAKDAKATMRAAKAHPPDDLWPLVVEFTLSQRAWWIGICADLDLTPMQGHTLKMLDPGRPVPMSILADALVCDASNVTGIVD